MDKPTDLSGCLVQPLWIASAGDIFETQEQLHLRFRCEPERISAHALYLFAQLVEELDRTGADIS
jgi:hypothetical protein